MDESVGNGLAGVRGDLARRLCGSCGLADFPRGRLLRSGDDRPLGAQLSLRRGVHGRGRLLSPLGVERAVGEALGCGGFAPFLRADLLCAGHEPVRVLADDRLDLGSAELLHAALLHPL